MPNSIPKPLNFLVKSINYFHISIPNSNPAQQLDGLNELSLLQIQLCLNKIYYLNVQRGENLFDLMFFILPSVFSTLSFNISINLSLCISIMRRYNFYLMSKQQNYKSFYFLFHWQYARALM